MAGWLSRLAFPGSGAPDAPQPFQITCECGLDHSGLRRKTSQQIICRTCGAALFVLPKNVYPPPADAKFKRPKPLSRDTDPEDVAPPAPPSGSGDYVPGSLDDVLDDVIDELLDDDAAPRSAKRPQRGGETGESAAGQKSSLPSPRPSRHQRRRERERQRREATDDDNDDEESATSKEKQGVSRKVLGGMNAAAAATGTAAKGVLDRVGDAVLAIGHGLTLGLWGFIRWWSPLRLVGLALVITCVSVVAWMIHANRIDKAMRDLRPSAEAGLKAFDEGDLEAAQTHLQIAVDALDVLNQDDAFARQTRQTWREATASNGLMWENIFSMLDEAETNVAKAAEARRIAARQPLAEGEEAPPPPPLDTEWQSRFSALYQGKWLLFEAPIIPRPAAGPIDIAASGETETRQTFRVEVMLAVGDQGRFVEVRADLPDFARLSPTDRAQPVIFAGQLSRCELSQDESSWVVEINPETSFLWTGIDTYRRLGTRFDEWHPAEPVDATLRQQAKLMQVEPLTLPVVEPQKTSRPVESAP